MEAFLSAVTVPNVNPKNITDKYKWQEYCLEKDNFTVPIYKQIHLIVVYDCRANQTKHPEAPQGGAENLGDDGEGGEAEPSSQSRRRVDRTQGVAATCVVQTQLPGGLGGLEAP